MFFTYEQLKDRGQIEPNSLVQGDCLEVMRFIPDNTIDTIVTDPPYGLSKEPDIVEVLTHWLGGDDYEHKGGGFMGKSWDSFVPGPAVWREALRVLKPGGIAMVFGGTRTVDLTTIALRMAGFEIRDLIMYIFGSGFPKSHNISKAIDKKFGAKREVVGERKDVNRGGGAKTYDDDNFVWPDSIPITTPATTEAKKWDGWGTALKPAFEPIIVAMKPRDGSFADNALTHGVAGLWIDGGRVEIDTDEALVSKDFRTTAANHSHIPLPGASENDDVKAKGVVDNAHPLSLRHNANGRWPANIILDGSDEVVAGFPETGGAGNVRPMKQTKTNSIFYGKNSMDGTNPNYHNNNGGSASRFFYCAKASKSERTHGGTVDNPHPTVKPLKLMQYLCRITRTPTGGIVLDPFSGSGSTIIAAIKEGRDFIGIEKEAEYCQIIQKRISQVT